MRDRAMTKDGLERAGGRGGWLRWLDVRVRSAADAVGRTGPTGQKPQG